MRREGIARNKKNIVAIDFFCGAGGVTNGFLKSGIKVLGGFDNDSSVKYAYENNNPGVKFFNLDIVDTNRNVRNINSLLSNKSHDLVIFSACAPCQPFSNQNKNRIRDKRKSLLQYFLKVLKLLPNKSKPDIIFFENVGPIQVRGKMVLKSIYRYLYSADYRLLEPRIIDASKFGVPQRRKRLIFIAIKKNLIRKPDIFNWDYLLSKYGEKPKTVREKIYFLKPIEAGQADPDDPLHISRNLSELNLIRIRQIKKPGGSRLEWKGNLVLKCHENYAGHKDVYGRMKWDDVAPTLTTKCNSISNGKYGHPEQDRAISLREATILQTMDNYKFEEPIKQDITAKMIGNAVPPLLAEKIGKYIKELIQ